MITTINEFKNSINEERKWKHYLKIKQYLSNDELVNNEQITNLINNINNKLIILKQSLVNDLKFYLQEIIENFDFIKDLADGTIPKENYNEYSFDGNFTEYFNDILSELYDFCDKNSIWVQ